jgi:uncharacterized SAM-binding protein YcdF (DUF218 family)
MSIGFLELLKSKSRKLSGLFLGGLCLGLALLFAGQLLVRNDGPHQADAIVVIGGDHKPERMKRAVELYQQEAAPIVIISAGTLVQEGAEQLPEAEVMRRQATALGLPASAFLIEDQSQSTFQNAYYTKALAQTHGFKTILLVTSAYQSRRALQIFQDVFGSSATLWVQPAPPNLCTLCWWFQPDQTGVVFYEYYNWVRYWLGIRVPTELPPPTR